MDRSDAFAKPAHPLVRWSVTFNGCFFQKFALFMKNRFKLMNYIFYAQQQISIKRVGAANAGEHVYLTIKQNRYFLYNICNSK